MKLEESVIWITGASSGIGEELALQLANSGNKLILSGRNEERLQTVADQCSDATAVEIIAFDLGNPESVQEAITKFKSLEWPLHVLINNGGVSQRSRADETGLEIDRHVMEVNYFGPIALTKGVLPILKEQQRSKIVTISSIAGKFGYFDRTAYSAAKHALHGFFESLRFEQEANGVSVLIACPGRVQTNISVNAVTATGKTHGKMDQGQAEGIPASLCAARIIKGIEQGKMEILVGGKEIKAVILKRFAPRVLYKILRKQQGS